MSRISYNFASFACYRVVLRAKAYEGETSIHDQVSSGALNNATSTGSQESSSTSTGTSGTYTWSTEGFPAADTNATGTAGAAKPDFTRYPSVGNHGRSVTPFYFNIGTVESFERKLEDAQKQLGISSRDYIPVIYIDETDWIEEFTRYASCGVDEYQRDIDVLPSCQHVDSCQRSF